MTEETLARSTVKTWPVWREGAKVIAAGIPEFFARNDGYVYSPFSVCSLEPRVGQLMLGLVNGLLCAFEPRNWPW